MRLSVGNAVWALAQFPALSQAQFNNPAGVDIWCGKAYRASNSSFDPGGWFGEPPISTVPLLDLRVRPRMSIYLETETTGSLLIDASISYQVGQPLQSSQFARSMPSSAALRVEIFANGILLNTTRITVGSTNNEVPIDLKTISPDLGASNVNIRATLGCNTTYVASTDFFLLPSPDYRGSVSRIDNLYGGLWIQRGDTPWRHIFPYTYYVQWSLYWDDDVTTLDDFSSLGYNVIHIVPTGTLGDNPFPWEKFEPYLDRADKLGLYLQYDVVWDYANLSSMIDQVKHLRSHPSLLLYYQSDEPDGKSNPINSTGIAYKKIRELDPYHPASLALNCYDFYYEDYAAGGDIILPDVYPISSNTSYSTVYDTVCNATYGCCGCDDCNGTFEDISSRLDEFHRRDNLIGWSKTHWFAPQAFGNETFWTRYPTAAEEVVMTMLGINHGAKGIVMWDFPTSVDILNVTNQLATILTSDRMADFILQSPLTMSLTVQGADRVDAAAWVSAEKGQILLSVVNLNYGNHNGDINILFPEGVELASVNEDIWGGVTWSIGDGGNVVTSNGLVGLQASIVILDSI
ncbi:hypothetical protein GQ53DRAFT_702946 [Thozetella sp. PMI_491]|nr:hypothetical protein GQ53DRAFT_702946 [Thozetella sp. PMI_491]